MLFALALERDPVSAANVPSWIISFLQDAGGFAAFGLAIWVLAYLIRRLTIPRGSAQAAVLDPFGGFEGLRPVTPGAAATIGAARMALGAASGLDRAVAEIAPWLRRLFVLAVVGAALVYGALGVVGLPTALRVASAFFSGETYTPPAPGPALAGFINLGLAVGGALALFAVLLPFAVDLLRVRWRRIWALSRLTLLEVSRRRVLWVFLLLALVFLFGTWFIDSKPENQVRSYVQVVYLAMAVLILLTSSLLSSFSIPTDIRQQTIHTVLTKPVERYEIFLGRFLGYTLVMTAVLALMTGFSLLYVLRGVSPEAADESLKARVPVYGTLLFEGTDNPNKATNVGDEWEYREYINGPQAGQPTQYAVWSIDPPRDLDGRDKVRCEFTFQIYRTTTGELNKGVFCTFTAESWQWDPARRPEFDAERKRLRDEQKRGGQLTDDAIDDQLAEKYGFYELPSKEVTNYHTQALELPGGLFRNHFRPQEEVHRGLQALRDKEAKEGLSAAEAEQAGRLERGARGDRPPLRVRVRCISRTQFVGMAKYDLYLLDREKSFMVNFFKGAVGIWFWMVLVIGVSLACSTYLSGVITWLCTGLLFLVGLFRDYVQQLALGQSPGGGPAESMIRLFSRQPLATQLEQGTFTSVATGSDEVYRWFLRRFINVLPDVDRYDFGSFVANGFNVAGGTLGLTLLFLAGYLLLWAVLGYYLIKSREIAGPT
jgi:ABC-type transport system involved in multi-copper enzyme maturation permease subunit